MGDSMESIEDILGQLAPYCRVNLFQSESDTWNAVGILRVNAEGADFKAQSGYRHPTACAALSTLRDRVFAMVGDLSALPQLPDGGGR